jgi:O-glycosyl hydrolase
MGGSVIGSSAEDEWVETIATLVWYARNTAGVQFSMLDPLNEPDWDGIEGPQVGADQYTRLLNKLSAKLDALGLGDIRLLGPSTASVDTGVNTYMPALMTDPVVMNKIDHFAFHNYAGYTAGADAAVKASAYPTKDFWISEVTNGQYTLTRSWLATGKLICQPGIRTWTMRTKINRDHLRRWDKTSRFSV